MYFQGEFCLFMIAYLSTIDVRIFTMESAGRDGLLISQQTRRFPETLSADFESPAIEVGTSEPRYSSEFSKQLRHKADNRLPGETWDTIKELGIGKRKRGRRAGTHIVRRITTIIGIRDQRSEIKLPDCRHNISNLIHIKPNHEPRTGVSTYNFPSFLLTNTRSMNNKIDEFNELILESDIDIAAVTETWFKDDMPCDYVSIPNYEVFLRSRTNKRGGGVAIYFKETLTPRTVEHIDIPDDLEIMWIQIQPTKLPRSVSFIIVAVLYYPPNCAKADKLIEHIHHVIDTMSSRHSNVGYIVMGDLNELDISSLLSDPRFVQCVDKPTRGTRTLDKIITNISDYYQSPTISSPLGASDHCTVLWLPLGNITKSPNVINKRTTNERQ